MRLYEHEGKRLLKSFGIAIPEGDVADTPSAARSIAESLGRPVVVKGQVTVGGRGKADGIALVSTPDEAERAAKRILDMTIHGETVRGVLVEERLSAQREIYVGVTFDRRLSRLVAVLSRHGGIDVEEEAKEIPQWLIKMPLDPLEQFHAFTARYVASQVGFEGRTLMSVADVLWRLVQGSLDTDLLLAEINPLFLLPDTSVVAADARVEMCDEALFRHSEVVGWLRRELKDALRAKAKAAGLAFVPLRGDIGIVGGGAGLCMATMDIVARYGGSPANFLDVGGGVSTEQMALAVGLVLSQPVRGVIVNVYGGINNCEMMAQGICQALEENRPRVPIVVKMRGHFEEEGWALLAQHGISTVRQGTTDEAARLLLQLLQEAE